MPVTPADPDFDVIKEVRGGYEEVRVMDKRKSGVSFIEEERRRQVAEEHWTPEHDEAHHRADELAHAAAVYASPRALYVRADHTTLRGDAPGAPVTFMGLWPHGWDYKGTEKADGRGLDRDSLPVLALEARIRELAKAGALIAAEIDRLQRARRA